MPTFDRVVADAPIAADAEDRARKWRAGSVGFGPAGRPFPDADDRLELSAADKTALIAFLRTL